MNFKNLLEEMLPPPQLLQFWRITDKIAALGGRRVRLKCLLLLHKFHFSTAVKEEGGGSISGASIIVSGYAAITCPEEGP